MRSTLRLVAPAALMLAVVFASRAHAQPAAPGSHQARVEERIKDMYATLHITKAQDAAWNAFADVMMDNAEAMDATVKKNGGDHATLTAPEILERYAAISAEHAMDVERVSAAFGVLYADLSPEQKQAADKMFRDRTAKEAEEHKERMEHQETK